MYYYPGYLGGKGSAGGILPEITQIVTGAPATQADIPITLADCTGSSGSQASTTFIVNAVPAPQEYVTLSTPGGDDYYAWFMVDGDGTDPMAAGSPISVSIAGTDSTDDIAAALASAIGGAGPFNANPSGSEVDINCVSTGIVSDSNGSANISLSSFTNGSASSTSNYQGAWIALSYFQLSGTTWVEQNCYLWFNAAGESSDPGGPGQGIQISGFGYGELGSDILGAIPIDIAIAGFGGKWTFSSHWTAVIGGDHSGQVGGIDKWGGKSASFPATFGTITYGANNGYRQGDAISFNVPGTNYYLWYRINGIGTNPNIAGKTGFVVDTAQGDTAAQVATKTKAVIDTNLSAKITTAISSNTLTLTNVTKGAVVDANKRATNFTITVTQQGK